MNEAKNKKPDTDIPGVVVGCGVFTLVLILTCVTYSQFGAMIGTPYGKFVMVAMIVTVALWLIVILQFNDPNYDKYRKFLLAASILTLILVIGHRAGYIDKLMFNEEVEKNKTEQQK